MDKVQKIREEVKKLKSQLLRGACSSQIAMETRCKEEAYNEVLAILDTMQEESVDYDKLNTMLNDALSKETKESLNEMLGKEKPVSDFEMALTEMIDKAQKNVVEPLVVAAQWKDELIKLAKSEEPVSEDLEKAAEEYSFNIPSEIFYDLSPVLQNIWKHEVEAAFKAGAQWQKEQINEVLLSEVLPCFMHGGEADEVVAKLEEVLNKKK